MKSSTFWLRLGSRHGGDHRRPLVAERTVIGGTPSAARERVDVNVGALLPPGPQAVLLLSPERAVLQAVGVITLIARDGRRAGPGENLELRVGEPVDLGGAVRLWLHAREPDVRLPVGGIAAAVVACSLAAVLLVTLRPPAPPPPSPSERLTVALRQPLRHAPQAVNRMRRGLLAEAAGECERAAELYRQAWLLASGDEPLRAEAHEGVARCRRPSNP